MKKRKNNILFLTACIGLACAFAFLPGCAVIRTEMGVDADLSDDHFMEKDTHYSEVCDEYGPPLKLTETPDGMAFLYENIDVTEYQFGLNVDYEWLRYIKFAIAKGITNRQTLVLFFDEQGILQTKEYEYMTEIPGWGSSLQLVIEVQKLVDTSYLMEPPAQHTWGRNLLAPIPVMLNKKQSLYEGLYGVELQGATKKIGQRTLEMHEK
jgi:hypothetical protein